MATYLGALGNLLTLPAVAIDGQSPVINGSTQYAIGGRGKRWRTGHPRRVFELSRAHASLDEWSLVEQLAWGGFGPGPFVLLLPGRRNLLPPNVASGTNLLATTAGFSAAAGTVTSTAFSGAFLAPRAVTWAVTAANSRLVASTSSGLAAADLSVDPVVLPSTPYTASVYGRLATSTGTLRCDIHWFTAAGAFISTSTGTAAAQSTSAWTRITCTATSPSTAQLAQVSVINTAMGAAQTIYLDAWQLEQASAASAFLFGTGTPRVAFDSLADSGGKVWERSGSFSLVEVG